MDTAAIKQFDPWIKNFIFSFSELKIYQSKSTFRDSLNNQASLHLLVLFISTVAMFKMHDPRTRLFSVKKSKPTSLESDPHRLETQQLRPTNGALAQLVARQIPVSFKGALENMLDS
ncbi:hypothetical protein HZ326_4741 [Fusarium oxysporum f. sp. albedinis]|nr:hypothetical protein HZ326_4741 [Fusarium oxysporum f. sp. albedinis]